MPTERGPQPVTCPTCGAPVRLAPISAVDSAAGLTRSYQPVKPREDPAAVERAAKVLYEADTGERAPEHLMEPATYWDLARMALRAAGEGGER